MEMGHGIKRSSDRTDRHSCPASAVSHSRHSFHPCEGVKLTQKKIGRRHTRGQAPPHQYTTTIAPPRIAPHSAIASPVATSTRQAQAPPPL